MNTKDFLVKIIKHFDPEVAADMIIYSMLIKTDIKITNYIDYQMQEYFNISFSKMSEIKERTSESIATHKHITMYLLKKYTNISVKDIGEMLGGKNHSTVSHACKRIKSLVESDDRLLTISDRQIKSEILKIQYNINEYFKATGNPAL